MFSRSGGSNPGRDGCRVPLPWSGTRQPFGFSPDDAETRSWLPQPAAWASRTVQAQTGDPGSMLELYRAALRIRRAESALGDGAIRWIDAGEGTLAFTRDPGFTCVVNLSSGAVALPEHMKILLASGSTANRLLPKDSAAWLRTR